MRYFAVFLVLFSFVLLLQQNTVFADVQVESVIVGEGSNSISIPSKVAVDTLSLNNTGFTTRFTSNDELRQYHFSSPSSSSLSMQLDSVSSSSILFEVLSLGLNDVLGTATGTSLLDAKVDGVSGQYTFIGTLNQIGVNAGKLVEEFFNVVTIGLPTTGGGGGGVPTSPNPFVGNPVGQTTIGDISVSLQGSVYSVNVGETKTVSLQLLVDSPKSVVLKSLSIDSQDLQIVYPKQELALSYDKQINNIPVTISATNPSCQSCSFKSDYSFPVHIVVENADGVDVKYDSTIKINVFTVDYFKFIYLFVIVGFVGGVALLIRNKIKGKKKQDKKDKNVKGYKKGEISKTIKPEKDRKKSKKKGEISRIIKETK